MRHRYRLPLLLAVLLLALPVLSARTAHAQATPLLAGPEISQSVRFGRYVFFTGYDGGGVGSALWRTDGTPGGTALAFDPNPGEDGYAIQGLAVLDDGLYFIAYPNGDADEHLYRLATDDGTPTTFAVLPNEGACGHRSPRAIARWNGYVYAEACRADIGQELFRSNGVGPVEAFDLTPGQDPYNAARPAGSTIYQFAVFNNLLYFTGAIGSRYELFVFDGTSASLALDVNDDPFYNSGVDDLVVFQNRLCFPGRIYTGYSGYPDLMCWDGTTRTTYTGATPTSSLGEGMYVTDLYVVGNTLYFTGGYTYQYEGGLWRFDGEAVSLVAEGRPDRVLFDGTTPYWNVNSTLFRALDGPGGTTVQALAEPPGWDLTLSGYDGRGLAIGGQGIVRGYRYSPYFGGVVAWTLPDASATPPGAPSVVTPAGGPGTVLPTLRLAWTPVAGAEAYQVEVGSGEEFYNAFSPSYTVSKADTTVELGSGSTYVVRVRAVRSSLLGPESAPRVFEVTSASDGMSVDEGDPALTAFPSAGLTVDFAGVEPGGLYVQAERASSPPEGLPGTGLRIGNVTWHLSASGTFASAEVCLPLSALPAGLDPAQAVVYKRPGPGSAWVELAPTLRPAVNPGEACVTVASFSEFGIGEAGASLPVELTAFTARADGRTARLSWTTASETNNAGFTVEQQTGSGTWADASALIAGRGTTAERHAYTFDVPGLSAGRHAFRLRQTDTDGAVHLSPAVTVEIAASSSGIVLLGTRAVRVELAEAEASLHVRLYDVLGREVSRLFEGSAEVGSVEMRVPVGLASGVYVVRAEGARFAQSKTLVVR